MGTGLPGFAKLVDEMVDRFMPGKPSPQLARARRNEQLDKASLIGKGMVYSPTHGDTAFTVPMFDEYPRRVEG